MRSDSFQQHTFQLSDGVGTMALKNGQSVSFPIKSNPHLEYVTLDALNNVELSPFGIR